MNQVVFLQVGQLSEVLVADLAPERTLSTVHSQMDLNGDGISEMSIYIL